MFYQDLASIQQKCVFYTNDVSCSRVQWVRVNFNWKYVVRIIAGTLWIEERKEFGMTVLATTVLVFLRSRILSAFPSITIPLSPLSLMKSNQECSLNVNWRQFKMNFLFCVRCRVKKGKYENALLLIKEDKCVEVCGFRWCMSKRLCHLNNQGQIYKLRVRV